MTPDEAINELTKIVGKWQYSASDRRDAALQLSIEALKRCKVLAENSPLWAAKPLPGETKE